MYVYIYICTYSHIYIYIYICMHMLICRYIYIYICCCRSAAAVFSSLEVLQSQSMHRQVQHGGETAPWAQSLNPAVGVGGGPRYGYEHTNKTLSLDDLTKHEGPIYICIGISVHIHTCTSIVLYVCIHVNIYIYIYKHILIKFVLTSNTPTLVLPFLSLPLH